MAIILYASGLIFFLSFLYCAKIITEMALIRYLPARIIRAEKVMLINSFAYLYLLLFAAFYFVL